MDTNQYIKFLERFKTEIVYLKTGEDDVLIRSDPTQGLFVKLKGKPEQPTEFGSDVSIQAVMGGIEVSKDEYYSF